MTKNKVYISFILIVMLSAYAAFIALYSKHHKTELQQNITHHSRVISHNLWKLDFEGSKEYLKLASKRDNLVWIKVYSAGIAEPSIVIRGKQSNQLERLLIGAGLVREKEISTQIFHKKEHIGQFVALHRNCCIYTYFIVLIFIFLLSFVLILLLRVISSRNLLEKRVLERTEDLTHEINERTNIEKSLRREEENLRTTLRSIKDGVIATDTEGFITRMNPVAEKLTGWSFDESKGKLLSEVLNLINANTRRPIGNLTDKVRITAEFTGLPNQTLLVNRSKKELRILLTGSSITSDTDEVIGIVFVLRDMNEEYTLQEKLRHARKMESIGQLAGGVAHDFNNTLGGIMGLVELSKRLIDRGENPDKHLNTILNTAERAASLTDKLLSFAKKQPLTYSTINLLNPLNDAISLLGNTIDRRIRILKEFSNEKIYIKGDSSQLQNTFMNLLINASYSMPEGGEIFVGTRTIELTKQFCDASTYEIKPGHHIDVEIRDTGCGIPKENINMIFEPFYTTRETGEGTGLGLSAVLGTVQQHNGMIQVYSEVGSGTSIHILLPLARDKELKKETTPSASLSGTGKTILIVDDEEVIRISTCAILEDMGFNIISAENGKQALDIFKQNSKSIDLVILDMIMPEMNGKECFTKMKKISPEVKVILSSGYSRDTEVQSMVSEGLKGFIRKPFRTESLCETIKDALPQNT
ncbi:MAG: hybrid sensor histidine kinase/response regulator [Planctomycetota bacterium]|jgi:PAS domain S-box-containing protein